MAGVGRVRAGAEVNLVGGGEALTFSTLDKTVFRPCFDYPSESFKAFIHWKEVMEQTKALSRQLCQQYIVRSVEL